MRTQYDEQLRALGQSLLDMGSGIEQAIRHATNALEKKDASEAVQAIEADMVIDQAERDIEAMCLKLLLHQQPVASDLRFVSAALKMITDMERIGDQAADIGELVSYLCRQDKVPELPNLMQMAEKAIVMVNGALDAYVDKDLYLARKIIGMDDEVDDLFAAVKGELIEVIRSDHEAAHQALDLMMIAKYYERIGDHAQNIAEWVEYAMTGKHKGVYLT
ncbi:MAG: phosphate signaling complex protein PhoU [Clostridia bacterium]|nr:phosphate signaling complex protein PhoU [Clostridia bacterium]